MSKTLWLMCGAPGSGKSYFAKNILINDDHWFYVSRDEIRFRIIKNDEEYFSRFIFYLFNYRLQPIHCF